MFKGKFIFIIIVIILAVAGVWFLLGKQPQVELSQKESFSQKDYLPVEQDLAPVELTPEEKQALQEQGLEFVEGEDKTIKELQTVRSSDELEAIQADLRETDLSSFDADMEAIEKDLSGQ